MNPSPLYCSGRHGQLSRYLMAKGVIPVSDDFPELTGSLGTPTLIVTYSPTQRQETVAAYSREIAYYTRLISSLQAIKSPPRIVFISSQTVILDDGSLYAKAKLEIESLFASSGLSCLLLRPGFIFTDDDHLFISSLALMASKPFTLGIDRPLFSACRASDILQRVKEFSRAPLIGEPMCRLEELGLSLQTLSSILDLQRRFRCRLSFPVPLLRLLAIASPKLRKIIHPVSKTRFPRLGVASHYDE
jgi:hypothetical protein